MSALEVRGVSFVHGTGRSRTHALAATDIEIASGRSLAVVGRSGAGKSTLAEIVLGLRRPATGEVRVNGQPWIGRRHGPRRADRRLVQGVPQDPAASFVPRQTIGAQITDALRRLGVATGAEASARVTEAAQIARLDLALLARPASALSGGQAQRAAIARAVAVRPAVIVADEPTSALDRATADAVASALLGLTGRLSSAVLIVTHDAAVAARCDATFEITPAGEDA